MSGHRRWLVVRVCVVLSVVCGAAGNGPGAQFARVYQIFTIRQ